MKAVANLPGVKPFGLSGVPNTYTHIIIGGGTAGCLLANRLSADPKKNVLVLEAGGSDRTLLYRVPAGYLWAIKNPVSDWMYSTQIEPGLNHRSIHYARGKVLGGCSSINAMLYLRGQARDYDSWAAQTGDSNWTWDHCVPYFKKHECHWRAVAAAKGSGTSPSSTAAGGTSDGIKFDPSLLAMHSDSGEAHISTHRYEWKILESIRDGMAEAGIKKIPDFNLGNNEGSSYFELSQKDGMRWSASAAFLPTSVQARSNLTVLCKAMCRSLVFADTYDENGQLVCTGVEVDLPNGQTETMKLVDRSEGGEVILAAGSIGTTQLLQLSGIGPVDVLEKAKVPIKLPLPVGKNLQDHLQLRTIFKVKDVPTLNTMYHSWFGCAQIAYQYLVHRRGPLAMAPSQLGGFAKTNPSRKHPNVEFHIQPLSLDCFGQPLHKHDAVTLSICNLNPTSRGSIEVTSTDPYRAPKIALNYLSTDEDRLVAAESIRLVRKVAAQPALKPYIVEEQVPGVQYQTDGELTVAAGNIGTTIFHPSGTCRMGKIEEEHTVVNPKLCVKGVVGLRVADCSVMPTITSGNTNGPTMMIAEKAAEWINDGITE